MINRNQNEGIYRGLCWKIKSFNTARFSEDFENHQARYRIIESCFDPSIQIRKLLVANFIRLLTIHIVSRKSHTTNINTKIPPYLHHYDGFFFFPFLKQNDIWIASYPTLSEKRVFCLINLTHCFWNFIINDGVDERFSLLYLLMCVWNDGSCWRGVCGLYKVGSNEVCVVYVPHTSTLYNKFRKRVESYEWKRCAVLHKTRRAAYCNKIQNVRFVIKNFKQWRGTEHRKKKVYKLLEVVKAKLNKLLCDK